MSAMFPLAVWQPGTLQPSTPVNDNALRVEILQRGATSILSTPPGSPADGQVHILGASPTGAWSTFAQNDVVLWRSGTWYRFAPFLGWLKQVGAEVRRFDGSAWVVISGSGGGAVPVQEEGTTVVASPTAINFVGAGVTATSSGGVATVTIPGGGGGGGTSLESVVWTASAIPGAGFNAIATQGVDPVLTGSTFTQALSPTSRYRSDARVAISQNTVAGWRTNGAGFARGSGGGGGYKGRMIFAPNEGATRAGHRLFIGARPGVTPSDVEPSSLTNIFGIGYDSADTQVHLFHNDAVGTATKVSLGASFPKPTANDAVIYDLVITCLPSAASVSYLLTERISGATASGSISTDIAATSVALEFAAYMSQGGGGAVPIQIDIFGAYFQLRPTA